nr:adenosylcobinamide amidohydrolase [Mycobacterium marseillense]
MRATGTASDAIVVHCPTDGTEETYGGPRSLLAPGSSGRCTPR